MALSLDQLGRLAHETYAAHCLLWNLGFEPEELYVDATLVANATPPAVHALVRVRRGGLEFVWPLGPELTELDRRRYFRVWRVFSAKARTMRTKPPQRDKLDRIVYTSAVYNQRMDLILSLLARGFELRPAQLKN